MAELEIRLTFRIDASTGSSAGYWFAEAGRKGQRSDWDGVGATPLDAVMSLAGQMHRALARSGTEQEMSDG